MSATKTGCLCSCPFASWLSAHSQIGMPVPLGHTSVNKRSLQTGSLLSFVRAIILLGEKKKRKRFEVVNSILLTNGYLHPIIPSASRDVLFNDLMQSSLSFKFDFQSLHFKWGKEKMVCQSWESLEMLIFFILILCIRDGKSKQSIIMCIMSLDTN